MNGSHHKGNRRTIPIRQSIPDQHGLTIEDLMHSWGSTKAKILTNLSKHRSVVRPVLVLALVACTYLILQSLHTHEIMSVYKTPIKISRYPESGKLYTSFQDFLQKQNIRTLIQIQCELACFLSQKQDELEGINVKYVDYLHEIRNEDEEEDIYGDWVNFNAPQFKAMTDEQVAAIAAKLRQASRLGVSLTWQYQDYIAMTKNEISRIRSIFSTKNLTYNTIQSLQIRRMEGKAIQIFTRFGKMSESFEGSENEYNLIAIQADIKLQRDIPFLREWIGYHATIGVDKFFIYHHIEEEGLECPELPFAQVQSQWNKILKDYQSSIIYIPWIQRKTQLFPFPLSLLFTGLPNSQHDYIYNFGKEISYTIFLNSESMVFSKIGMKLSSNIKGLKVFNNYQIEEKYFLQRYCSDSNFMLQNYQYYDDGKSQPTYVNLFLTQQYEAYWGHNGGYIRNPYSHVFSNKQFRVNKYSFNKKDLNRVQSTQKYPNLYLSYDFSAESRIALLARICESNSITVKDSCQINRIDCINRDGKIM